MNDVNVTNNSVSTLVNSTVTSLTDVEGCDHGTVTKVILFAMAPSIIVFGSGVEI